MRIGPYEITGELGRGGMGSVYRARDANLGRDVAIKLLLAGRGSSEVTRRRFAREIETLARLSHPNIVNVHAAGDHEGYPYLVMDLVAGEPLRQRLDRGGPLHLRDAVEVVHKLAIALEYAHSNGVIHRDIKPANILMTEDGEPRLTDFGLAKDLDMTGDSLSKSGRFLGTPGYWPPEQAMGELSNMGPCSDIYSLGATLYDLLTGVPPVQGSNLVEILAKTRDERPKRPSTLRPEIDGGLDAVCMKCLEKEPEERYASAEALAEDLECWLAGGTVSAASGGARWAWIAGALAVFLVCLLGGLYAVRPDEVAQSVTPTPAVTRSAPVPAATETPREPSPALFPLKLNDPIAFRLIRTTSRPNQSKHVVLVIRAKAMLGTNDDLILGGRVESVKLRLVRNGQPLLDYDSTSGDASTHKVDEFVAKVRSGRVNVALNPTTGQVRGVGGFPPPPTGDSSGFDPLASIVSQIVGDLADQPIGTALLDVLYLYPAEGPPLAGAPWQVTSSLWVTPGVQYRCTRRFEAKGDGVNVIMGRAKQSDHIRHPNDHPDFRMGELEVQGAVEISERGLESSEVELSFEVVAGTYPGPRTTRIQWVRVD